MSTELEYIQTIVIARISEKTQIDPNTMGMPSRIIEDLDMDSMDMVELEFELEIEFKIALNFTEGVIPVTVQDIVNMIAKKLA